LEREIPLYGWQNMSYQICAYILTVILRLLLLYVGYYGGGSENDTKEFFFMGMRLREHKKCLGGVGQGL